MINYGCDFNQSEREKYFEWIIIAIIECFHRFYFSDFILSVCLKEVLLSFFPILLKMAIISFPQIRLGRTLQSQNTQRAHGFLSPDFLTVTIRTGCETMDTGGMTKMSPEEHLIRQSMLTWSHQLSGWPAATILRSRVVMTPATCHYWGLKITVWVDKHSAQKSQVMATLETARCGPTTHAWEDAWFSMLVSTVQQTGLIWLGAMVICKPATRSASGVTGVLVMGPSWWLVEEEISVHVLITGLE